MNIRLSVALLLIASLALPATAQARAANFRLIDQDGRIFELYRHDQAEAIVLVAFDPEDATLLDALPAQGKRRKRGEAVNPKVVLVVRGASVSRDSLVALRKQSRTAAPILLDPAGSVSRKFGLARAGDMVLIVPGEDWAILGHTRDRTALTGSPEAFVAATAGPGDDGNAGTAIPSYSREVAPILLERCVNCHQGGGIGPFALSSHKKVLGWAAMMEEVILTRRMPPWHADPAHQHFRDALALSPAEENTLMTWLAAGAPKDDAEADPLATQAAAADAGWAMGEPDLVLRMPKAVDLPATGVIDYEYMYVPSGLSENKWVRGLEVRAGNPAAVHHALIFISYPPEYAHVQPRAQRGLSGFFASFLPGSEVRPFPEGTAQFVPAGSTFIFQMHYNTTGKPESDRSELGLYFASAPPTEVLQVGALATDEFKIKPQRADQPISVSHTIEEGFRLWGVLPHMHYRGQEFRYTLEQPGRPAETLLNVPWYQFDWQPMYWYDAPKGVPAGATLRIDGAFDNSAYNALNPDPDATVYFGEQSFDEMFIGYLCLSKPYDPADYAAVPVSAALHGPLTEAGLTNTEWDVGEARPLRLMAGGKAKLAWYKGTWKIEEGRLAIEMFGESFGAEIVGDSMFLEGERMTRIK